jgi:hypothetical protein
LLPSDSKKVFTKSSQSLLVSRLSWFVERFLKCS